MSSLIDCRPHFKPTIVPQALGAYTAGICQDEQVKSDTGFWNLARSVSASTEREMEKMIHFSELPVLNMIFSQVILCLESENLVALLIVTTEHSLIWCSFCISSQKTRFSFYSKAM